MARHEGRPDVDGRKYQAELAVAPGFFTVEQRRRLEAVTAARHLVGTGPGTTILEWLRVADYIVTGDN